MELPRHTLRRAAHAAGRVERAVDRVMAPGRNVGFPYRAPTVPRGVEVPEEEPTLGADYDTDWARSPIARAAREVIAEGPMRLVVRGLADPEVTGTDRLDDYRRRAAVDDGDDDGPAPLIFAPTHHSHLDTALMVRAVPLTWRRKLVVAAAADYFFDKRWKAVLAALSLNAVPIDRESTGRRSADLVRELVNDGWSLVIYPEGGRSPDGWGQDFKGGAAYVSARTGAPVVPVFIDGTGSIYGKGMKRPRPGRTRVVFGTPLRPVEGESTRRFNARIYAAVTTLADEATTDFWTARRRAAKGSNPTLSGPAYTGWRRQWDLSLRRREGIAGWRRPPTRRWPEI
ncbi:MAG: lysophospholipid acyltransferase family protein [Ilumatobacteraceae bacterium]